MSKTKAFSFASLFCLGALSACTIPETELPNSTSKTSDGGDTTTVGVVDDSKGFEVFACMGSEGSTSSGSGEISECAKGKINIHKAGNVDSACEVDPTATAWGDQAIECVVEGHELDVFFHGMSLAYNVPTSMCKYFEMSPYHYWNYEVGAEPTAISYKVDKDTETFLVSPTVTPVGSATVAASGEVTCTYNYTSEIPAGPNCCEGKYTLAVSRWVPGAANGSECEQTGVAPDIVYVGCYVTEVSTVDMGGIHSSCLAGPAIKTQARSRSGFPKNDLYNVDGTGINGAYSVAAPLKAYESNANIYASNYFSGATPASLSTRQGYTPQSAYEFLCLDNATEVKARIRVRVREWNTEAGLSGYLNGSTLDAGADAAADAAGVESGDTSYPENDYLDWNDFGVFFPKIHHN